MCFRYLRVYLRVFQRLLRACHAVLARNPLSALLKVKDWRTAFLTNQSASDFTERFGETVKREDDGWSDALEAAETQALMAARGGSGR